LCNVQVPQQGLEKGDYSAELDAAVIDLTAQYDPPTPVMSLGGSPIFTAGDISAIVGNPGSRKTMFCTLLAAGYLTKGKQPTTNNPITDVEDDPTGVLLWIDTEQNQFKAAQVARRVAKMIEGAGDPGRMVMITLREYEPITRLKITAQAIERYRPRFVLLDGVADLINDVNNIDESAALTQWLMATSTKYDCHICSVIHSNIGDPVMKPRGHAGANILRKAVTVFRLQNDATSDVTNVDTVKCREKTPSAFAVRFDESAQLPVFTDYHKPKTEKVASNDAAILDAITGEPPMTNQQLKQVVQRVANVADRQSDKYIKRLVDEGSISKLPNGLYTALQK